MADIPVFTPVHLLTGFLGSGKTTLLKRLLADPALADTAVLINEFGEVGLDHQLVERIDDTMVLLQSVVAFVFMERHYNQVTLRLSSALAQDIAALVEIYEHYPRADGGKELRRIADEKLRLNLEFLPPDPLPPPGPKPFFDVLDSVLSQEIARIIQRPASSARICAICRCCSGPMEVPNQASLLTVRRMSLSAASSAANSG